MGRHPIFFLILHTTATRPMWSSAMKFLFMICLASSVLAKKSPAIDLYVLSHIGTCHSGSSPIRTTQECEIAAAVLKLNDTSVMAWPVSSYTSNVPSGCWLYNNELRFNNDPDRWNYNGQNGHVTAICKLKMWKGKVQLSYPKAAAFCKIDGGQLVTIHSALENTLATKTCGGKDHCWIGLKQVGLDNKKWTWIDGSTVDFTNWAPGEPNNHLGVQESRGEIYRDGTWNDLQSKSTRFPLCEPKTISWVLGRQGENCRSVCKSKGASCVASKLWPQSAQWVKRVANKAGKQCKRVSERCDMGEAPLIKTSNNDCYYCSNSRHPGWRLHNGLPKHLCERAWKTRTRLCPCQKSPLSCKTGSGSGCRKCSNRLKENDHCASCNAGYDLVGTHCKPFPCSVGSGSGCATCDPQSSRRIADQCGSCNKGYFLGGNKRCYPYDCDVGSDMGCKTCIAQNQRTTPNHCASCNAGYRLVMGTCDPHMCFGYGSGINCRKCHGQAKQVVNAVCSECNAGFYLKDLACAGFKCQTANKGSTCKSCLVQNLRTDHLQCSACNSGYYLEKKTCKGYSCRTESKGDHCRTCVGQKARNKHDHCASCNLGYYLRDQKCVGYSCATGSHAKCKTCQSQHSRVEKNHCTTCNGGYNLLSRKCHAWKCDKGPGSQCKSCVTQKSRVSHSDCAECNSGFYLKGKKCLPYNCVTGPDAGCKSCQKTSLRTAENHCATCNSGYYPKGTECTPYLCRTSQSGPGCRGCRDQHLRTAHEQCTSCNFNYFWYKNEFACVAEGSCMTGNVTPQKGRTPTASRGQMCSSVCYEYLGTKWCWAERRNEKVLRGWGWCVGKNTDSICPAVRTNPIPTVQQSMESSSEKYVSDPSGSADWSNDNLLSASTEESSEQLSESSEHFSSEYY